MKIPIRGGRYTEAVVGGVPTAINPLLPDTATDPNVTSLIFSGLSKLDGQGNVYGDLADTITLDPEGKIYTFHIRDNATWHDGQPVTPQDVLFTIHLIQDPHFPGDPALADFWRTVTVDLPGGNQVRFTLQDRYAPFLSYTTLGLLPQHLLGGIKAEELTDLPFNLNPVGTGPYRFVSLEPATPAINLTLWQKHYQVDHRGGLFRAGVALPVLPLLRSGTRRHQAGEGIGRDGPLRSAGDQSRASRDGAQSEPEGCRAGSSTATTSPPTPRSSSTSSLRSSRIAPCGRRRVTRSTGTIIVQNALGGQGIPGDGPIHPSSWAYKTETAKHPFDPDLAKKTLDDAGWKVVAAGQPRQKDGVKLSFTLVTNSSGERPQVAQIVATQLTAVGFDVQVNTTALSSFDLQQTYLEPHRFDAAIFGWDKLLGDPDPYILWHSTQADGGYNFTNFRDSEADQLLENGRRATNPTERKVLYNQFQDLFASEVPAVVLYYPRYVVAIAKNVNGVEADTIDTPADRFRGIARWYIQYRREDRRRGDAAGPAARPRQHPGHPARRATLRLACSRRHVASPASGWLIDHRECDGDEETLRAVAARGGDLPQARTPTLRPSLLVAHCSHLM